MDEIAKAIVNLKMRDWWDICMGIAPLCVSVAIIIQAFINHKHDMDFQNKQYVHDIWMQNQTNILEIYGVYYEFNRALIESGIWYEVSRANTYYIWMNINVLLSLKNNIGIRLDKARLLLSQNESELFDLINERFLLGVNIIDGILDYYNSGRMETVANNAWSNIKIDSNLIKNYYALTGMPDKNYDFIRMCRRDDQIKLEDLYTRYRNLHQYDCYDQYFEKFFSFPKSL